MTQPPTGTAESFVTNCVGLGALPRFLTLLARSDKLLPASIGQTPALGDAPKMPARELCPARLQEGTTMIGRAVANAAHFEYAAALVRVAREAMRYGPLL
jgi:hypothetical protein